MKKSIERKIKDKFGKSVEELAEECGVMVPSFEVRARLWVYGKYTDEQLLQVRSKVAGSPSERAKRIKKHFGKSMKELAEDCGIKLKTFNRRVNKWIAGEYTDEDLLRMKNKFSYGNTIERYGWRVEDKAKEIGVKPSWLRYHLSRVEAGKETYDSVMIGDSSLIVKVGDEDTASVRAALAKIPGPTKYEEKYCRGKVKGVHLYPYHADTGFGLGVS